MKAEVTRASRLAPEAAPHTICFDIKLVPETEEDKEIINSILQFPGEGDWLAEVGSFSVSCDGRELEIEILL